MTAVDQLPVKVITSARRKNTVSARIVDGTIEIRMPEGLSSAEQQQHIDDLTSKLDRKRSSRDLDLPKRARKLAREYSLPEPSSIVWSSRQQKRWGSCTPATGAIRISDRMAEFPDFVIDYVIVHELAHLVELNHSPAFTALERRYPHADKAEGFLMAVSLGFAESPGGTLPDFDPCINLDD